MSVETYYRWVGHPIQPQPSWAAATAHIRALQPDRVRERNGELQT